MDLNFKKCYFTVFNYDNMRHLCVPYAFLGGITPGLWRCLDQDLIVGFSYIFLAKVAAYNHYTIGMLIDRFKSIFTCS